MVFFDKIKMNSFNNYFKYIYFDPNEFKSDDLFFRRDYKKIYNKNEKTELLKKDLLKYNVNIDDFKNYAKNYFVTYKEKFIKELNEEYLIRKNKKEKERYMIGYIDDEELKGFQEFNEGIKLEIDINSPLFDIFYKSKLLDELFIIPIDFRFIKRYKLKEDYITVFNKLNDINSNYSSLFLIFYDDKDISYLKYFNIKLNKIKNLSIEIDNPKDNFDYNLFYRELFSLKDIENNIIDLHISLKILFTQELSFDKFEIDENILENLNKFKKLEHLILKGLRAKNIFELKLKTLKTLKIDSCDKIYINADAGLYIKKLILLSFGNISKSLLKLPQLEYLENPFDFNSFIDFNSLNNLKKIIFFLDKEFIKILSIKSLKEIHITSRDLEHLNFDLTSIYDKNLSVNKLIYNYRKNRYYSLDYNIDEILNKFPNLMELIFIVNLYPFKNKGDDYSDNEINLEIKENPNCKINKITLFLFFGNFKFDCQNYEKLEKFEIKTNNYRAIKILNISNSLPMFSNNKKIIYNSLIELNLYLYQLINLEIFKNLNNNIDNMPNLKKITLYFITDIDKNTYEEFIKKILSMKLEFINIHICFSFNNDNDQDLKKYSISYTDDSYFNNNNYSIEELKKINENILKLNFENIKIKKYILDSK